MAAEISAVLWRLVAERLIGYANTALMPEMETYLGCEVDHIISRKHGGLTESENLASACFQCNRHKGTDVGSIGPIGFIRFFNPRSDRWNEHFRLDRFVIEPSTAIGQATASILQFNTPSRLRRRQLLFNAGRYPTIEALARIRTQ